MRLPTLAFAAVLLLLGGVIPGSAGCGPKEAPAAPAPPAKPEPPAPAAPIPPSVDTPKAAPPAPAQAPEKAAPAAAAPTLAAPSPSAAKPAPTPEAKATPAPKPQPQPQAASPITDPGGEVAVKASRTGLTRVGASACKLCHKVQFASWSETAHAKRTPALDCEGCHGLGSEYKALSIMKDPAKAKAAGLIQPGAAFCATCHKRGWNDGLLKKAHAHKA